MPTTLYTLGCNNEFVIFLLFKAHTYSV